MNDDYDFHENGGFGTEPTKGEVLVFIITVTTVGLLAILGLKYCS